MDSIAENLMWEDAARELANAGIDVSECIRVTAHSMLLRGHQKILSRDVVVKVLMSDEDKTTIERFLNETRLLATLDHPNIVRCYGAGALKDGSPYFLMEFLEGRTLRSILDEHGPMDEARVRTIGALLCQGLSCAHQRQIIHRDIKPENIMVFADGSEETVKLIDFGIFKSTGNQYGHLTQAGSLPGTANYMSPEQCSGKPVDSRSDIYSLGCVLYELLCGVPPMNADSDWLIMDNHIHRQLKKIPSANPISASLSRCILKSLKKNPADRWTDADTLRADLQDYSSEKSVQGARKRGIRVVLVTVLLVVAVLCGIDYVVYIRSSQSQSVLNFTGPPSKRPTSDITYKLSYPEFSKSLMERSPTEKAECARIWLATHYKTASWHQIGDCLKLINVTRWNQPLCTAIFGGLLARSKSEWQAQCKYKTLNDSDKHGLALAYLLSRIYSQPDNDARAVLEEVLDSFDGQPYQPLQQQLFSHYLASIQGRPEKVVDLISGNLPRFKTPLFRAYLLSLRSARYQSMGMRQNAAEDVSEAIVQLLKTKAPDAATLYSILECLQKADAHPEIRRWYKQAKGLPPPETCDAQMIGVFLQIASSHFLQRDYKGTADLLAAIKTNPRSNRDAFKFQIALLSARVAAARHDRSKALKLVDEMIDQMSSTVWKSELYTSLSHAFVAITMELPETYPEILALKNKLRGMPPKTWASLHANFAQRLIQTGNAREALMHYTEAIKYLEPIDNSYQSLLLNSYNGQALALRDLGKMDEAFKAIEKALQYSRRKPGTDDELSTISIKGSLLRSFNKTAEAIDVHKTLLDRIGSRYSQFPSTIAIATRDMCLDYEATHQIDKLRDLARKNLPLLPPCCMRDDIIDAFHTNKSVFVLLDAKTASFVTEQTEKRKHLAAQ